MSASSILTEPLESSTDSKTIPDSMKSFSMFSIIGSDLFLFTPNEFLEMLKILISEFILISQKALLEKVLLFTINGDMEDGIETTLEIKAAFIFTDNSEAKYLQLTLSDIIILLAPVLFETLEINSEDLSDLPNIFLNYKFNKKIIIFIDDLSFEQNDRRYIQFKSFLEGSFYNSNYEFLVYVTSNRRHLMKRDMLDNERSSAISQDEGIEEKLSLSDRFGLWISFHNLSKKDFILIIKNYCKFYKVEFDNEIENSALKWIFSRGNRTGRSAYQFFKYYCSSKNIII